MGKKFDRLAFILGMKKQKYPQAFGKLFILGESGDLYACAMGQGILDSGFVSEDEIRQALKPRGTHIFKVREADGRVHTINGRYNSTLETEWASKCRDDLGSDFWGTVTGLNDGSEKPLPEIGAQVRAEFNIQ